jgi:hypothetical protein
LSDFWELRSKTNAFTRLLLWFDHGPKLVNGKSGVYKEWQFRVSAGPGGVPDLCDASFVI